VDDDSLAFDAKCDPLGSPLVTFLGSPLVTFLGSLDSSYRNLFDDTSDVVIEALMYLKGLFSLSLFLSLFLCFFLFFLSGPFDIFFLLDVALLTSYKGRVFQS